MTGHVYVVDDDDRFRDSLCALIGSVGLQVVGWSDPEILLKRESLDRPGCVVLDYRLPSLSGLDVLRLLRQKSSVPTILISAYADVQTTVAAMELGAATVFEKPIDDNSFLNRLERFCFEDDQWVLKRRSCEAIQKKIARLTETERAVLDQLRLGLSNKAMARNLSKSVKAIERQRQNVVHKLDCKCAMEVMQKVQACPLQVAMPLTCSRDSCPACFG
ncbi:MAG: response regulator [Rhizomicrobium sp.]|jgi:two-component system response regulator FixJ